MSGSPFAAAVEALRKPLLFAARDDFAHASRVKDLERSVAQAADVAAKLAIPEPMRDSCRRIAQLFAEPLEGRARVEAVRRALELSAPLASPARIEAALAAPLDSLPGLGARRAELLAKRGLRSVGDLLFHFPADYDDRRAVTRIGDLEVGRRATFVGEVLVTDQTPRRGRRIFQAVVGDDSGTVGLKWFRGADALQRSIRKGSRLLVTGDVRRYRFAKELIHPEVEVLGAAEGARGEAGDAQKRPLLVPRYAAVEGIPPRTLRGAVARAVATHADLVAGWLPPALVKERGLPTVAEALREIHDPPPGLDPEALRDRATPAHQRLVLEELYLLELGLALRRAARGREPGIAIEAAGELEELARRRFPFTPTRAQEKAWEEIRADLGRPHPMNRLLQGDVGSGKTAVAALAAVRVAEAGHQTALMAPTELLAEQHARTLGRLVGAEGGPPVLRMGLLTASVPRLEAQALRTRLAAGDVDLVVGTHALVQEDVAFARLALAVIDEQHRFGVLQRAALAAKTEGGASPHVLVMTATPIPRTLSLTVYGDLDVSVIDELPPGRSPVTTDLLREGEGRQVVDCVRRTLERGEQVYVVYPLVEETEGSDLRAATEQADRIRRAFPDVGVDLVHGRLDAASRAEAMARFEAGESRILVSTTVIEVGVDVPNATLMVIEHAERFGLAQLHQLRGRVGRGERPGTCLLVARGATEDSEARLRALLDTTDGFRIADADLRIRGPGEFLGTKQHGRIPELRIADLVRDARLVSAAREAALAVVRRDSGLRRQPGLARAVRARWGERLALADVG